MAFNFLNLNNYFIKELPDEVFYIPNFISQQNEETLLCKIYSTSDAKWTNLSKRRLQNWGGIPHSKGMYTEKIPPWLNIHCEAIKDLFEGKTPNHILINEYEPGQGIMPHEDGPLYYPTVAILSLQGNCLMDFYKPVSKKENHLEDNNHHKNQETKSSDNTDDVHKNDIENAKNNERSQEKRLGSVYVENRSLIIFRSEAYKTFLHGINECTEDKIDEKVFNKKEDIGKTLNRETTRVSLTIRVVPKTLNASKIFGKKLKF